jgi:formate dehydrogenase
MSLVRAGADKPSAGTDLPLHCIDYRAYVEAGGYALAADCAEGKRQRNDVIALMEDSGLRGLGGAGFPAGRKWKIVAAEPAPRLMAVNIDEGEPGTFKDRYYLERDPHRFLEGSLIAAWAVGIDDIYIYLRDEYTAAVSFCSASWPAFSTIRLAGFRGFTFAAALVRTSAAKNPR